MTNQAPRVPGPIVCVFALAAALSPAAVAQEARTTKQYDVRFLVAAEQDFLETVRNLDPAARQFPEFPRAGGIDDAARPSVSPEVLLALVRDEVGASVAYEQEGPRVDRAEGLLIATCDSAGHRRIEALLDQLRLFLTEQVTVEMHVLPGKAVAGARALLDREQADRLLRDAGAHAVFVGPARVGAANRVLLDAGASHAFVRDYDVEVAQGSTIQDPQLGVLRPGCGWGLRVDRSHDGRLLVTVSGASAAEAAPMALREIRSRDQEGAQEASVLQLPRLRILQQQARAVLGDGEAMLLGSDAMDADGVWCLRIRRPRPVAAPAAPGWALLPVHDLVSGEFRSSVFSLPLLRDADDERPPLQLDAGEPPPRVADSGYLTELLLAACTDREAVSVQELGNALFVRAPAPELQAVSARLTEIAAAATRQVTVELRYGLVAAIELPNLLDGRADVAELAGRLDNACLLPTLLQDWFGMRCGREQAFVRDYTVEIAQFAAIPNPEIATLFDGIAWRGSVLAVPGGQFRLALHFAFAQMDGDIEQFDPRNSRLGTFDQPRLQHAHFAIAPIVEDRRWTLLHVSPLGADRHLAVVGRVSS